MITFTEVSALGVAICLATTILRHRAPGMTLNRMPILLWEKLVISIAVIFAMPAVMVASGLLLLDRLVGTHFFNPAEGGDVLLYQHLFWFGTHPEVYIIFLPGAAIVSTLVECFPRRRIFGYTPIVVSVVATGFIGFSVWVHHMFATGLPQLSEKFLHGRELDDCDSHWGTVLLLGSNHMVRAAAASVADALVLRLFLRFSNRWTVGSHAGFRPGRFASPRYLLCCRALSLCAYWRRSFSHVRRHLFLVPKDNGTNGQLNLGEVAFLAVLHWFQYHILHAAFSRIARHAPSCLHLQPGHALAGIERARVQWCCFHDWQGRRSSLPTFSAACALERMRATILGETPGSNGPCLLRLRPTTFFMCQPSVAGILCGEDPPDQPVVVGLRDDIRETLVTHSLDA